jgi:hypothetical protein
MFKKNLFILLSLIELFFNKEVGQLEILGIEPNAGPVYGETRVLVRLKDFDRDLIDEYDRPKVRNLKLF